MLCAVSLTVSDDTPTAELSYGRPIAVPLTSYPRLAHATPEERGRWSYTRPASTSTGPTSMKI